MNQLIQSLRQNDRRTTNGMVTHSSSLNACVDLFFLAGASRRLGDQEIERLIDNAFEENPEAALKLLFWARDVRGGAGERRFFRIGLKYLHWTGSPYLFKVLHLVPEYGRWDDLFIFAEGAVRNQVLELIRDGLLKDQNGLLAKWLPRKGTFANAVRKHLGLTPKAYRKLLVELSSTVEQKMCAREWKQVEYQSVPSQAMNKYRKAFFRHDQQRFDLYIEKVQKGKAKINAGAIYPYQLYQEMVRDYQGKMKKAITAQWEALPNYMAGSTQRILPVCDTSGSMSGMPMDVSISLGLYISERNESVFKDAFITFSERPQLQYLKGNLYNRCRQLQAAGWGMNTNLEKVFELILKKATEHRLPASELPTKILIISDMEFDMACKVNQTALQMIQDRYKTAGYEVPGVIFWNVRGRIGNVPASAKAKNVALVSGFSPSILKSILAGTDGFTPESIMLETIMGERYAPVQV